MQSLPVRCVLILSFAFGLAQAVSVCLWGQNAAAEKQSQHITLTEADLDGVTGVYGNVAEPESEISVFREGSHIFAEGARLARFELFALSRDRFINDKGEAEFDFSRDISGKITGCSTKGLGQADPAMQRI